MRRAARTDDNHAAIVAEFRRCGVTVRSLAAVGQGVPDLLCAFRPRGEGPSITFLIEVKDGAKSPSKRRLTEDQVEFHRHWPGLLYIVERVSDVPNVILAAARGWQKEAA